MRYILGTHHQVICILQLRFLFVEIGGVALPADSYLFVLVAKDKIPYVAAGITHDIAALPTVVASPQHPKLLPTDFAVFLGLIRCPPDSQVDIAGLVQ